MGYLSRRFWRSWGRSGECTRRVTGACLYFLLCFLLMRGSVVLRMMSAAGRPCTIALESIGVTPTSSHTFPERWFQKLNHNLNIANGFFFLIGYTSLSFFGLFFNLFCLLIIKSHSLELIMGLQYILELSYNLQFIFFSLLLT